jgi:hypothetical protein
MSRWAGTIERRIADLFALSLAPVSRCRRPKKFEIVCIRSTASFVSSYEWSDVSIKLLILVIHSYNYNPHDPATGVGVRSSRPKRPTNSQEIILRTSFSGLTALAVAMTVSFVGSAALGQPGGNYTFTLNSFKITETRSLHNDTDFVAISVAVGNKPPVTTDCFNGGRE